MLKLGATKTIDPLHEDVEAVLAEYWRKCECGHRVRLEMSHPGRCGTFCRERCDDHVFWAGGSGGKLSDQAR